MTPGNILPGFFLAGYSQAGILSALTNQFFTMSNVLGFGVGGLLLGILLGIVGVGMAGKNNAEEPVVLDRNGIEGKFIEQMIPHHEGAIAMARVALEKGEHDEIKSLAQGIIDSQEKENADMRAWYEEWFRNAPLTVGEHSPHAHVMDDDLVALEAAPNFDVAFIDMMIPHHEMAVATAELLGVATEKPEMLTLADQIISSQTREIEMMRSWKSEWTREDAEPAEEESAEESEEE